VRPIGRFHPEQILVNLRNEIITLEARFIEDAASNFIARSRSGLSSLDAFVAQSGLAVEFVASGEHARVRVRGEIIV
jgi:hypothetical protein